MLAHTVISAVVEGPAPEDVKAGWVALIIWLLLALAVALLGFSLFKHLRISRESRDLGLYGDSPVAGDSPDASDGTDPAPGTSAQDDSAAPGGPTQSS